VDFFLDFSLKNVKHLMPFFSTKQYILVLATANIFFLNIFIFSLTIRKISTSTDHIKSATKMFSSLQHYVLLGADYIAGNDILNG
jgi:cadmium resistance protein CadD (predicted permease)